MILWIFYRNHDKRVEFMESSRFKYIEIEVASSKSLEHIIEIKTKEIQGFKNFGVHVDDQLYKSKGERAIKPAYAANEHVSVIELRIRTVKERMRLMLSVLPYKTLPKILVRDLIKTFSQC